MKCPVCNSEMSSMGYLFLEKGNDSSWNGIQHFNSTENENVPWYECNNCKQGNLDSHFAYQRVLVQTKWYYFNWGKWNFLKEETFNPSRRE